MVLRIRLSRFGKKHAPFYNIVLTHARTARNSRPLEVLGTYNPIPQPPRPGDTHGRPWKDIKLDVSRARYWVGVGAQPSDTAWRLLSMVSRFDYSRVPLEDRWREGGSAKQSKIRKTRFGS
jgi:small subunit ribosomal protein S16